MKYTVTYYYSDSDIQTVIEQFKEYHNITLTEVGAIKIIRYFVRIFGQSFLAECDVRNIHIDEEIQKIIS